MGRVAGRARRERRGRLGPRVRRGRRGHARAARHVPARASARGCASSRSRACRPRELRSVEMFGDRVAVLIHDKALLDEEDIFSATFLVYGKSDGAAGEEDRPALVPHARARSASARRRRHRARRRGATRSWPRSTTPTGTRRDSETLDRAARLSASCSVKARDAVKVAVFGGSFNPPHVAHVLACALVLAIEDVDRLLVVPAYQHPFAKALAPLRRPRGHVRARDGRGCRGSRSRGSRRSSAARAGRCARSSTSRAQHPDWRLRLVIGADILAEAPRWFGFDAIAQPRAAASSSGAPGSTRRARGPPLLPEVSSTRGARRDRARAPGARSSGCVPRAVLAHVAGARALWRAGVSARSRSSCSARARSGTALARALRAKRGARSTLRAARKGLPRAIDADVVVARRARSRPRAARRARCVARSWRRARGRRPRGRRARRGGARAAARRVRGRRADAPDDLVRVDALRARRSRAATSTCRATPRR